MPSRNPYGCVFWPTYLLPFLDRDAAALGRFRFAAGCGAARLRVAGGSALASAVPALTGGVGGASPPATWISTWLVRVKIGVGRPIAAWVKRLRVGPSFTTAYWTRSRSASKAAFSRCACCSAFATADFSTDRKSTRLNSSHVRISYAVFCLKKKKKTLSLMFIKKET